MWRSLLERRNRRYICIHREGREKYFAVFLFVYRVFGLGTRKNICKHWESVRIFAVLFGGRATGFDASSPERRKPCGKSGAATREFVGRSFALKFLKP